MKLSTSHRWILITGIAFLSCLSSSSQQTERKVSNFNFGWKFHRGDVANGQSILLDDSGWRNLDLPHDWSIEGPFSKDNYSCTGYLPGGIGWYRKSFTVFPKALKEKKLISASTASIITARSG